MLMLLLPAAFPAVLLALLLLMERVERPLADEDLAGQIPAYLDTARPEEVEAFVRNGSAPALERYWRRRSRTGRAPTRSPAT
jgi:hypothetical protein